MKFEYHPEAAREMVSSVDYYEEIAAGLGLAFLDELEVAIEQALAYPESGAMFQSEVRRILLNRFPFEIIYEVSGNVIFVYAIKHLKRKPDYWKSRK